MLSCLSMDIFRSSNLEMCMRSDTLHIIDYQELSSSFQALYSLFL